MRTAARTDGNQVKLVSQLRQCGCSVFPTHQLGKGFPDIVVGIGDMNYLFEIKDPAKPPSKRKLTPDEQKFFDSWRGQIHKVETLEDCLIVMGLL